MMQRRFETRFVAWASDREWYAITTRVISEEVVGLGCFSSSGATPRSQRSRGKGEEGRGKTRWPKVGERRRRCSSCATLRIDSPDTWTSLL